MVTRSTFRLVIALLYLGAVFFGAWHVYKRMQIFEGEIFIANAQRESVVVRPSASFSLAPVERNMPAEVIHFDNPTACRRWFDSREQYDAAHLPFSLRLDDVTVLEEHPPENRIEVTHPEGKETHAVHEGDLLNLDGATAKVTSVQPWAGLIRNASGVPMACFSIRRPGERWTEYLFINSDLWLYLEPSIAVRLRWFTSKEMAETRFPSELAEVASARWGVTEGRVVHWFESLIPGAGITLRDGTEVTLLKYEEEHPAAQGPRPAILVGVKRDEEEDRPPTADWTVANEARTQEAGQKKALIRFDCPTRCDTVIYLNAWRDNAPIVAAFQKGALCGKKLLEEGRTWQPADAFPYELRLDQAISQAVPVEVEGGRWPAEAGETIWGAVLEMPSRQVRLREGEVVRIGDARLRYHRRPVPPAVTYTLTAAFAHASLSACGDAQAGGPRTFDLAPGASQRCGDWVFSQKAGNPNAGNSAALHATRTLGGPAKYIGLSLFAAGSFVLVILRFHKPRAQ